MGESMLLLKPVSLTTPIHTPLPISIYIPTTLPSLSSSLSHRRSAVRSIPLRATWTVLRVVSESQPAPTLVFDPEIRTEIGGGDGGGDRTGGGGGGGGGGGEGEGGGGDREEEKKKVGMTMSQKFTLVYAALVGVGGLMGYMKTGSTKSLAAGGISAAVLGYVYTALPTNPTVASAVGLGISAALLGVMGSRFKKSGKVFPAGVVSAMSLVMTAGYLHGIMRTSSH